MQCLSCGAEIPAGASRCPSCGTLTSSTPPQTSESTFYDSGVDSIPYVEYSRLTAAPPAAPPDATTGASPAFPTNREEPAPQQQVVNEKRAGRPGILRSTAVLLIILAGLLVVGGGGVAAYATVFHTVELNARATAVTQNILTGQAEATATADANSPQNMYNRITTKPPSFTDPLDGQHTSPWSNDVKGNSGCAFKNGAYHLQIAPQDLFGYCLATGSNYSNFLFQVQETIIQGLDAGVVFRTTNPSLPSYIFTITYSGLYALNVSIDSQHGKTLAFGRSSAINTGLSQPNLLGVMARNGNISLFINKHFVTTVSDKTYTSGAIGLVASNFPQTSIDIAYNNAFVWNLQ